MSNTGNLTISGVTITGGQAVEFGQGAGILVLGGALAISECRVIGNAALSGGGGIALAGAANPPATATVTRCEIARSPSPARSLSTGAR